MYGQSSASTISKWYKVQRERQRCVCIGNKCYAMSCTNTILYNTNGSTKRTTPLTHKHSPNYFHLKESKLIMNKRSAKLCQFVKDFSRILTSQQQMHHRINIENVYDTVASVRFLSAHFICRHFPRCSEAKKNPTRIVGFSLLLFLWLKSHSRRNGHLYLIYLSEK